MPRRPRHLYVLAATALLALVVVSPAFGQYDEPSGGGLTVSTGPTNVAENGGTAVFTVMLDGAAPQPVSVNYETWNGSATAPADFVNSPGTVTIPAGSMSAQVAVPVVDDALPEQNEVFFLHLASVQSGPATVSSTGHHGTGTIVDNDGGGGGGGGGTGYDTQPPDTFIHGGPARVTRARRASFHLASTEAGSKFQCKLDRRPWRSCGASVTLRRLTVGWHTFRARAIDAAGNVDPTPRRKTWRVRR